MKKIEVDYNVTSLNNVIAHKQTQSNVIFGKSFNSIISEEKDSDKKEKDLTRENLSKEKEKNQENENDKNSKKSFQSPEVQTQAYLNKMFISAVA